MNLEMTAEWKYSGMLDHVFGISIWFIWDDFLCLDNVNIYDRYFQPQRQFFSSSFSYFLFGFWARRQIENKKFRTGNHDYFRLFDYFFFLFEEELPCIVNYKSARHTSAMPSIIGVSCYTRVTFVHWNSSISRALFCLQKYSRQFLF